MSGGSFMYIGNWMWSPDLDAIFSQFPSIAERVGRDYADAPGTREFVAKLEEFQKRCAGLINDFEMGLSKPLTTVDRVYSSDDGPEQMKQMLAEFGAKFRMEGSPCPECNAGLVQDFDGVEDRGLACPNTLLQKCDWRPR